ncbi:DEAD/DEAH box helicase [Rickettsiales endosymbiont of Paramecium tredecaurelia]|uniref:DEAD/DEAH box helicase n=1 Tax=Candidatus Sarmatiella mevalonica TaxID=2770581 RepID=UPI0019213072|nr:DEAD/DEAH box helicase [Candidatus Sarmatiella mevalonica]MBL3284375.1 DEAD/DEAH box helicase [Candidatus Sarmatiella mevalonica]
MENFSQLPLAPELLSAIEMMNFTKPTAIQALVIPPALTGVDILGSARTGSGKTAAFGIPLVSTIMNDPHSVGIIITPTRELAAQVAKIIHQLLIKSKHIRTTLLIGGQRIEEQIRSLSSQPRIIVGTPGRIGDHLARGSLKLDKTKIVVLDEADRMLDMGFTPQIENILKFVPTQRQVLLFSATMPSKIRQIAKQYMSSPLELSVAQTQEDLSRLNHEVKYLEDRDKYDALLQEIETRQGSVLVFVRTKMDADRISRQLRDANHMVNAIHGDLSHGRRSKAMADFKSRKCRIMIATDVAARGIDVGHLEHVINYDLPNSSEDHIHRVGRTARGERKGNSLSFVTPSEKTRWAFIMRVMKGEDLDPAEYAAMGKKKSGRSNRSFGTGPAQRSNGPRPQRSRFAKGESGDRWRNDGGARRSNTNGGNRERRQRSSY